MSSSKDRTGATEAALRCLTQRDGKQHKLGLAEIHRVFAGEWELDADSRRGLAAALEHAAAAQQDRKAA